MCQWLKSLNIPFDKNRVAEYRKTSQTIVEHKKRGALNELEKSLGFPRQADNFHDVSELVLIQQHLSDYDCPLFNSTLVQAVNDPTSLAAERPQSSDARNKVFELSWLLDSAAGFPPRFVEPADAIISVDDSTAAFWW